MDGCMLRTSDLKLSIHYKDKHNYILVALLEDNYEYLILFHNNVVIEKWFGKILEVYTTC